MIKQWLINIGLVIVSLLIGLVLAEGLLRCFLPTEKKRIIYNQTRDVFQYNKDHVQFNANSGYLTKPNLDIPFSNKEFTTNIQTNSLGFRDDENSCQDPDVLVLGDSFGFGWGVEKDECFESILEQKSKLKILNMSVSGYNNVQELALLDQWEQTYSLKNKTIILMYYVNDMLDNIGTTGVNPSIDKTETCIKINAVSMASYNNWIAGAITNTSMQLAKNFYTIFYLRNAYSILRTFGKAKEQIHTINPDYLTGSETRIFSMILEKLNFISQTNNCKIIIAYIPYSPYLKKVRYSREYFFLKYMMSAYNFDLVDFSNRMGYKDYYVLDEHWNANGHKKAAMILNEYLLKKYE